jgi:hypothetical protein
MCQKVTVALEVSLMSGSSYIRSVLIGIKYRNCCRTLDVYLPFAIWLGQIQLKLIHIQKVNKHPQFDDNFDIRRQLGYFEYDMNRT